MTPDLFFTAPFPGDVSFPVPNNRALLGLKFHLQRADLSLDEYINAQCATNYIPTLFRGTSNGVTGTIGL